MTHNTRVFPRVLRCFRSLQERRDQGGVKLEKINRMGLFRRHEKHQDVVVDDDLPAFISMAQIIAVTVGSTSKCFITCGTTNRLCSPKGKYTATGFNYLGVLLT